MKDHEIAKLISELTKLMQETPDTQKRSVLSSRLVPLLKGTIPSAAELVKKHPNDKMNRGKAVDSI